MRVINIIGCCLTLAAVVRPSEESIFPWGKKDEGGVKKEIDVGLVSIKEPIPSSKGNSVQSFSSPRAKTPESQAQANDKSRLTNNDPNKPRTSPRTETTVLSSPARPNIQRSPPPDKPIKPGEQKVPMKPVDKKVMQDPKAAAAVAAGTTAVAVAQKQIDKNKQAADKLEKQVDDLKKDLKTRNRDESLEDLIEDLLNVTKKRFKVKFALVIYAIINFIVFIAANAGSFITPPVGKTIYFLDLITKNVIRKPLDDWFAEYQKENAEIVLKYIRRHPEQFKNVKKGKRVTIQTPQGKFSFKILKTRPGEPLLESDLHIVDAGPIQTFRTVYELKR